MKAVRNVSTYYWSLITYELKQQFQNNTNENNRAQQWGV